MASIILFQSEWTLSSGTRYDESAPNFWKAGVSILLRLGGWVAVQLVSCDCAGTWRECKTVFGIRRLQEVSGQAERSIGLIVIMGFREEKGGEGG